MSVNDILNCTKKLRIFAASSDQFEKLNPLIARLRTAITSMSESELALNTSMIN